MEQVLVLVACGIIGWYLGQLATFIYECYIKKNK